MSKHTLVYPQHAMKPESLLNFIETTWFSNDWKDLGLDDEDDLSALQISIMCSPEHAPVMGGTGGLRKMRFSPPSMKGGKSGGLRVCYSYYKEYGNVLLVLAYSKTEKLNLSAAEKKQVAKFIAGHRASLKAKYYK